MPPLSSDERRALLALARFAILETVVHERVPDLSGYEGPASRKGAAFVTVRCRGELRGCVGRTDWNLPLGEVVAQCAISAVARDPRFPPILPGEVREVEVELSLLSEFQPIALASIVPGRHGLYVVRGARRGLLLPQVAAEHGWSAERFLMETCEKAGLEPAAWRDEETQVFGFTAEVFCESDLRE